MSNFHTSAKVLNFIDTRPKDNEVKGAVQLDTKIGRFLNNENASKPISGKALHFQSTFDKTISCSTFAILDKQDDNLQDFINRLSNQLGQAQSNSDKCDYGLMFDDGRRFVTDENKHLIQQGFLLILTASPTNYALTFLAELRRIDLTKDCTASLTSLTFFVSLAADSAFAKALKEIDAIKVLIKFIVDGVFETNVNILCQILQCFLVFMGHSDVINWEEITKPLVEKIAVYVNGSSKIENNDSLYLSLNIILNVMSNCNKLLETLKEEVKFESLIRHVENSDERILLSSLSLMNVIYSKLNNEEKQSIVKILHGKPFVAAIERGILRESRSPDQRIRIQLVEIQNILVEELRNLALRLPTEQEIDYIIAMEEWNPNVSELNNANLTVDLLTSNDPELNIGYEEDLSLNNKSLADANYFKKLLSKSPPGSLALCAILEFTRPENRPSNSRFREIQLESSLRPSVWPVVMASIATSLIRLLGIYGSKRNAQNRKDFTKLILKSERPFYDIFGVNVELFHRTWREMHANVDDLDKVISVVDDQMLRALALNLSSLEDLEKVLQKKFSYFHMQKIWERERIEQEELELNSIEIQSLRDHLRPGIEQLVMERKKSFLKNGLVFTKFSVGKSQVKEQQQQQQQFWFWKLDKNERFFCYSDCKIGPNNNTKQVELDLLSTKKISIFNIQKILHGLEYSNQLMQQFGAKFSKKNQPASSLLRCGFSIELSGDSMSDCEQLHFSSNNENDLNCWVDGINCLISPQLALQLPQLKAEVERLLNLEVRVRLLDVPNASTYSEADFVVPEIPTDLSWIPKNFIKS